MGSFAVPREVDEIYQPVLATFRTAKAEGITTYKAADRLAEERFTSALWLGGVDSGNLAFMPKAKSRTKPNQRGRAKKGDSPARVTEVLMHGGWSDDRTSSNGMQYEYQRIRNPYVAGEREGMLEKRQKLTLKAFRIAYENQHQRKSS